MSKVSISESAKAIIIATPAEFAGSGETRAFYNAEKAPIQVYQNCLAPGAMMRIGPTSADSITYVWQGDIETGGQSLPAGSSFIVEQSASAEIRNGDQMTILLTFQATRPSVSQPGAHLHLLPRKRVPYSANLGHASRVGGGMHSNASELPIWLHENDFPAPVAPAATGEENLHCHSEDEVIFVVDGNIRLGNRLYGPGTALAIAADTFYSFEPGPAGLKFINFRAGLPSDIRTPGGITIDEVAYWRDRLPAPEYITLESSVSAA
jgi:hypothetical protein